MRTERFNKAYTALINAYHNGTLAKGTCMACAVGNIVADSIGKEISIKDKYSDDVVYWNKLFCSGSTKQKTNFGTYPSLEDKLLLQTGYTAKELSKVEKAFEFNAKINVSIYSICTEQAILEDQFNGLSAVLDVLLELDDIQDNNNKLRADLQAHPKLNRLVV